MPALIPILIGTTIASTAVQAVGAVKQGNAAANADLFNAQAQELQAQDAEQRGTLAVNQQRAQVREILGGQRAAFAAQGVDINAGGSPTDVAADTAYRGELDAQTIKLNADREAWGYRVGAQQSTQAAANAKTAGYFGALTATVGGASSIANTLYGWQRNSLPNSLRPLGPPAPTGAH